MRLTAERLTVLGQQAHAIMIISILPFCALLLLLKQIFPKRFQRDSRRDWKAPGSKVEAKYKHLGSHSFLTPLQLPQLLCNTECLSNLRSHWLKGMMMEQRRHHNSDYTSQCLNLSAQLKGIMQNTEIFCLLNYFTPCGGEKNWPCYTWTTVTKRQWGNCVSLRDLDTVDFQF